MAATEANHENAEIQRRVRSGTYAPDRVPEAAEEASGGVVRTAAGVARRSHLTAATATAREFASEDTDAKRKAGYFALNRLVKPLEESALRVWSEREGMLRDGREFQKRWVESGQHQGAEHDVFFDHAPQRWFKRNHLTYHGNWLEFFQRLQLHAWLFPGTVLELEGFVDHQGTLLPLLSQAHVRATRGATREEVHKLMEQAGFVPHGTASRADDYQNTLLGIEVNDLHDENAVITESGAVAIFDPVPMLLWESKLARLVEHF